MRQLESENRVCRESSDKHRSLAARLDVLVREQQVLMKDQSQQLEDGREVKATMLEAQALASSLQAELDTEREARRLSDVIATVAKEELVAANQVFMLCMPVQYGIVWMVMVTVVCAVWNLFIIIMLLSS